MKFHKSDGMKKGLIGICVLVLCVLSTGCGLRMTGQFEDPADRQESARKVSIELEQNCDTDIYGVRYEYYIDGKALGGGDFINANQSRLERGTWLPIGELPLDLLPEETNLSGFSIQFYLAGWDGTLEEAGEAIPVDLNRKNLCRFRVCEGSGQEAFFCELAECYGEDR